MQASDRKTVFLTGATGYVGGRLAPRLLQAGCRVRCLARSAQKLAARPWATGSDVEIIEADAGDVPQLTQAMRGCDAAYYLIHSMEVAGGDYARHDKQLAAAFAQAAQDAGSAGSSISADWANWATTSVSICPRGEKLNRACSTAPSRSLPSAPR